MANNDSKTRTDGKLNPMGSEKPKGIVSDDELKTTQDPDTAASLLNLADFRDLQDQRVSGVRTILVVLSSRAIVLDVEALRQKALLAYPDAAVFFMTTAGKPVGVSSPQSVDLLVDMTGPGQRQGWFFARKLRKMAKFAVGRNAGLFRKKIYDRIFDEKSHRQNLPNDYLERERYVQKQVLALAGIPVIPAAGTTADRARTIALELPPLAK